jgi:hypothetical protein
MKASKSFAMVGAGATICAVLLLHGCGGGDGFGCDSCVPDLRSCSGQSDCRADEVCELDLCFAAPTPTAMPTP